MSRVGDNWWCEQLFWECNFVSRSEVRHGLGSNYLTEGLDSQWKDDEMIRWGSCWDDWWTLDEMSTKCWMWCLQRVLKPASMPFLEVTFKWLSLSLSRFSAQVTSKLRFEPWSKQSLNLPSHRSHNLDLQVCLTQRYEINWYDYCQLRPNHTDFRARVSALWLLDPTEMVESGGQGGDWDPWSTRFHWVMEVSGQGGEGVPCP